MAAPSKARLAQMHGKTHPKTLVQLHEDPDFIKALHEIAAIGMREGELPLV
jgi:beta-N-acetylhexosaminidase